MYRAILAKKIVGRVCRNDQLGNLSLLIGSDGKVMINDALHISCIVFMAYRDHQQSLMDKIQEQTYSCRICRGATSRVSIHVTDPLLNFGVYSSASCSFANVEPFYCLMQSSNLPRTVENADNDF